MITIHQLTSEEIDHANRRMFGMLAEHQFRCGPCNATSLIIWLLMGGLNGSNQNQSR